MSHLRAKVQQTSGQTLKSSHHFLAQFQNSLARQAGTGGRSSNVQKIVSILFARPPYPSLRLPRLL